MLETENKSTATTVYANGHGAVTRARADNDWYVEPRSTVEALLSAEKFEGAIYDPACGSGNIPKVAKALGFEANGADIVFRGYGDIIDFLDPKTPWLATGWSTCDNIVCNPPFKLAEKFLERALQVARHKVAFLLRLSFLEGQKRRLLFQSTPPAKVYVCSSRISMPPGAALATGEVKATGGSVAFAWYVWDKNFVWRRGPTILDWLP